MLARKHNYFVLHFCRNTKTKKNIVAALGKIGIKLAIGALVGKSVNCVLFWTLFCEPFGGEMLFCGKSVNFVPLWTLFCGPFVAKCCQAGKSIIFVPFWTLFCGVAVVIFSKFSEIIGKIQDFGEKYGIFWENEKSYFDENSRLWGKYENS